MTLPPKLSTSAQRLGFWGMYTALGDPPITPVVCPNPKLGNITASNATTAATTATAVEALGTESLLIALPLFKSGLVFQAQNTTTTWARTQIRPAGRAWELLRASRSRPLWRGSRPGEPIMHGHALPLPIRPYVFRVLGIKRPSGAPAL